MPLYGNDLDTSTNPYEAGLGSVVKLDKPDDFVGRAALRKVAEEGPARLRVGLIVRGRGHRPARLPGPGRRAPDRCRHERHAVADAGRADRDGLRRAGRRATGYDARRRGPGSAGPGRGRVAAVLPPGPLTHPERARGPTADRATAPALRARPHRRPAARPPSPQEVIRPMVPADLRYTKDHEWVRLAGDVATVGITAFAAEQLGDIVFVELPDVGRTLEQFATFGVVESVKAVSDLFAPVGGEVVETNAELAGTPGARQRGPLRGRLDDPGAAGRRGPARRPARRGRLRRARRRPADRSMPYGPHTPVDRERMLRAIGVPDVEELFADIPPELRASPLRLAGPGPRARAGRAGSRRWPAATGSTWPRSWAPARTATGRRRRSTSSSCAASGTRRTRRTSRRSARARSSRSTSTSR